MTDEALDRAVTEHNEHVAHYTNQFDGKGGIRWRDDGGLSCSCGWSAPRTRKNLRPWRDWHQHVVEATLAAFESAPTTGRHVDHEVDPTESSFAAMARKQPTRRSNR